MRIALILFLITVNSFAWSQTEWQVVNEKRLKTSKNLMLGLGTWSGVNMVAGSIGWATAPNDEMISFHSMNVAWNAVNLGIAIAGYVKAKKSSADLNFAQTLEEQRKVENVFLINAGADIAYISTGLILRSEAKSNPKFESLMNGFGNSLLIQGGFLLVFDWVAYAIHKSHRKKNLTPLLNRIELSDAGLGLKYNIGVH